MNKTCVKCGCDNAHAVKYIGEKQFDGYDYVQEEYLEIKCSICGYTTEEPCKDAPKETRIS